MLHFSEIIGKQVVTEDGIVIGKLKDLIFLAMDRPLITKLCINPASNTAQEILKIPISFLIKINDVITIKKMYEVVELTDNELYVQKNVLDQQIIDIEGNKVVRVNDVLIQDKPDLFISGVDVGFLGVLRWLKLEDIVQRFARTAGVAIKPHFLPWTEIQPLELARGRLMLKHQQDKLEKLRPEDLADHLEKTNIQNVDKIVSLLDKDFAGKVIQNLNLTYQQALFRSFTPDKAAEVLSIIDIDEAVDILLTLSERRRDKIIQLLPSETKNKVVDLLRVSSTPIGELMMTEVVTVLPSDTARKIIDRVKKETKDFYFFNNIYVVNDNDELIGVFNTHELLLNDLDTPVYKYMSPNVIVLHLKTPKDLAIKKMLKYELRSLPVIDETKKVLGIVIIEDLVKEFLPNV